MRRWPGRGSKEERAAGEWGGWSIFRAVSPLEWALFREKEGVFTQRKVVRDGGAGVSPEYSGNGSIFQT